MEKMLESSGFYSSYSWNEHFECKAWIWIVKIKLKNPTELNLFLAELKIITNIDCVSCDWIDFYKIAAQKIILLISNFVEKERTVHRLKQSILCEKSGENACCKWNHHQHYGVAKIGCPNIMISIFTTVVPFLYHSKYIKQNELTRLAHAWKPEQSSFVDKILAPVLPVNWPGTNFELAQADIWKDKMKMS